MTFPGLNNLYDYPIVNPSPVHAQRSQSYRCSVCAQKISKALYVDLDTRCKECDNARKKTIDRAFNGRKFDAPVMVGKEAGAALGHYSGVECSRCNLCRAPVNFCGCAKSVRYQFSAKEWRVR